MPIDPEDRRILNSGLARAIAYHQVGKKAEAQEAVEQLLRDLATMGIYKPAE